MHFTYVSLWDSLWPYKYISYFTVDGTIHAKVGRAGLDFSNSWLQEVCHTACHCWHTYLPCFLSSPIQMSEKWHLGKVPGLRELTDNASMCHYLCYTTGTRSCTTRKKCGNVKLKQSKGQSWASLTNDYYKCALSWQRAHFGEMIVCSIMRFHLLFVDIRDIFEVNCTWHIIKMRSQFKDQV